MSVDEAIAALQGIKNEGIISGKEEMVLYDIETQRHVAFENITMPPVIFSQEAKVHTGRVLLTPELPIRDFDISKYMPRGSGQVVEKKGGTGI